MTKEEIKREVRRLVNKCIYFDLCDFIDVVYTHFEKIGVFDYKSINKAINEYSQYIVVKNK